MPFSLGTVRRAALDFPRCIFESMFSPSSVAKRAESGLLRACGYLIVLFVACVLGATLIESIVLLSSALDDGSGDNDDFFNKMPDFEIVDGRFVLKENLTEPYWVTDNFVVDTTGNMTKPPVDDRGVGMLVTEDALIRKRAFREDRYYFSDYEGYFTNKQELKSLMGAFSLILYPLVVVTFTIFNILFYAVLCGILALAFTGAVFISSFVWKKRIVLTDYSPLAVYSLSPVLIFSVVNQMVRFIPWPWGFFLFLIMSVLWSKVLFFLSARIRWKSV